MKEIQGKSILVRVSARFELVRVRVIGSQLFRRLELSAWTLILTLETIFTTLLGSKNIIKFYAQFLLSGSKIHHV